MPMFSTLTCGNGAGAAEAAGGGSTATLALAGGIALAGGVALGPSETVAGGVVLAATDAATRGSGCGIGVDGARSQAALARTAAARTAGWRRRVRVRISDFLLQENVG
jgi:hypothetical protein